MKNIDEYILEFPEATRIILEQIRFIIEKEAPDAVKGISYGMPAYKTYNKPLVYFAAYKKHIGFYATPTGHKEFAMKLSKYKQGKGSVQFPLDQPIPYDLIKSIIKFRIKENQLKYQSLKK